MRGKVVIVEEKDGWGKSYLQFLTSYDDYVMDEGIGKHAPQNRDLAAVLNGTNQTDTSFGSTTPEGYSVPHIIITTILVSVIMFVIVFGNLLVVLAIFTDKTLKTVQNWFIACLAVADTLLGLVVMPFSLANEMMGYWYFGSVWCELWKVIDVLLSTASILSICLISLDRYWSITRAVTYSRQRTPKRAAMMIAAVWFLSAVICVPPLIGWKNPLPISEYPLCILSDDIGYVLYSTMGSFYIPCIIMVFVYFKIYMAAKKLARKNIRKKEKPVKADKCKQDCGTDALTSTANANGDCNKNEILSETSSDGNLSPAKDHQNNKCGTESNSKSNHVNSSSASENEGVKLQSIKTDAVDTIDETQVVTTSDINAETKEKSDNSTRTESESNKDSPKGSKRGSNKSTKSSKSATKKAKSSTSKNNKGGWKTASLREHERQKRRLAKARERRATIVLGIVMAAFILCWFPFFTLYIITSFCNCIGNVVFTVVFWAGYCNSALNPIIYTVFNRDFRHAFHRIIFTQWKCR